MPTTPTPLSGLRRVGALVVLSAAMVAPVIALGATPAQAQETGCTIAGVELPVELCPLIPTLPTLPEEPTTTADTRPEPTTTTDDTRPEPTTTSGSTRPDPVTPPSTPTPPSAPSQPPAPPPATGRPPASPPAPPSATGQPPAPSSTLPELGTPVTEDDGSPATTDLFVLANDVVRIRQGAASTSTTAAAVDPVTGETVADVGVVATDDTSTGPTTERPRLVGDPVPLGGTRVELTGVGSTPRDGGSNTRLVMVMFLGGLLATLAILLPWGYIRSQRDEQT